MKPVTGAKARHPAMMKLIVQLARAAKVVGAVNHRAWIAVHLHHHPVAGDQQNI